MTQCALTFETKTAIDDAVDANAMAVDVVRFDGSIEVHGEVIATAVELVKNVPNQINENGTGGHFSEIGSTPNVAKSPASYRVVATSTRAQCTGTASGRKWTAHEQDELRMSWGHHTVAAIARALNRAPDAVYRRAGAMGLGRGIPQGFESVAAAAKRTGYYDGQLLQILHWANVCIRPAASSPSPKNCRHIVEPSDVDAAVARWCAMETIKHAARRTDRTYHSLLRARAAGGTP